MAEKTYKVKIDITPDQVATAVEALNPFYAFGAVLSTAGDENGTAWVTLYDGAEEGEPKGDEGQLLLTSLVDGAMIVDVNAGWSQVPSTYCGPVLTVKHFLDARDAFMALIDEV